MRWLSDERGTTSAVLLMVWGLIMAMLAYSLDLALVEVYKQQMRTAVEAAVTAGARETQYQMRFKLTRTYHWWDDSCQQWSADGQTCIARGRWDSKPDNVAKTEEWWWERHTWIPYHYQGKQLWQVLHLMDHHYCDQAPSKGDHASYHDCTGAAVVECRLVEERKGSAVLAAKQAYDANAVRFQNKLKNPKRDDPTVQAEGMDFQVLMTASGEMPTMFAWMFGKPTMPIRFSSADLGAWDKLSAKAVRAGDDPCRSL